MVHSNPNSGLGFGENKYPYVLSSLTSNNFDRRAKQISPWLVDLTIANKTSYREAIFLRQILVERIGIKKTKSLPIHTQSIDIQHGNIFIR